MSLFDNLKNRWGVNSNIQVILIFITFALSGSSSVYVMKFLNPVIGIGDTTPFWLKLLSFVVLTLPVYNIILIIIGTLLGQHTFFRMFIIKFFRRMFGRQ